MIGNKFMQLTYEMFVKAFFTPLNLKLFVFFIIVAIVFGFAGRKMDALVKGVKKKRRN